MTPLIALVVEDNPLVMDLIVTLLEEAGFAVTMAYDGDAAVKLLAAGLLPKLLWTDIIMPGVMDGWDVAEFARARDPSVPVVYASGYSTVPSRQVAGGILIRKPFTPPEVFRALMALGFSPPPGVDWLNIN